MFVGFELVQNKKINIEKSELFNLLNKKCHLLNEIKNSIYM